MNTITTDDETVACLHCNYLLCTLWWLVAWIIAIYYCQYEALSNAIQASCYTCAIILAGLSFTTFIMRLLIYKLIKQVMITS